MHSDVHRGFTLVEMVLVLTILSIMSMMALRYLGDSTVLNATKYERSNELLEDVMTAVSGSRNYDDFRIHDSRGDVVGHTFVSDIGRLPVALPKPSQIHAQYPELTLSELFVRPDGMIDGVLATTNCLPVYNYWSSDNLATYSPSGANDKLDQKGQIRLRWGWRGPYLKNTGRAGESWLKDAWGNEMISRAVDNGPVERLITVSQAQYDNYLSYYGVHEASRLDRRLGRSVKVGDTVYGIRHLGANGLEDVSRDELAEITNSVSGCLDRDYCEFFRTNTFINAILISGWPTSLPEDFRSLKLRLYYPNCCPTMSDVNKNAWLKVIDVGAVNDAVNGGLTIDLPSGKELPCGPCLFVFYNDKNYSSVQVSARPNGDETPTFAFRRDFTNYTSIVTTDE